MDRFVSLTPQGDEWFETERLPEIISNETGQFDTLLQTYLVLMF